ncbi:DUF2165 family protein [Legionella maioricensis]|uniref:DUF2165 domain-containing protein n=1 Tax=Legionella maioricensis TaxID=2896528 RepID=A0A9X2IB57_9GAMM|nr:DUF2165 domain-containing protein [Legionella maioricensis]MCL9683961.1 DUF2165 domain-containing protein [Legionella maioricensis]MCL9687994.1 DUF2165 domain-containing protein [Legionella maioricensis]
MLIRFSKILCVAAISLFCVLTAFGNISDYYGNFPLVERALTMRDAFPNSTITYRAITNPVLHHLAYLIIITMETLTALLCIVGTWKLFRARNQSAVLFNKSKNWAIAGLTLGFLTWQVLFMSIGGEWFGIWMSQILNGAIATAFHIFITVLAVLIYVGIKDE